MPSSTDRPAGNGRFPAEIKDLPHLGGLYAVCSIQTLIVRQVLDIHLLLRGYSWRHACRRCPRSREPAVFRAQFRTQAGLSFRTHRSPLPMSQPRCAVLSSSDGSGLYNFPNIDIGTYTVDVTATGFESYRRTGVVLEVGSNIAVNVSMTSRQRRTESRGQVRSPRAPDRGRLFQADHRPERRSQRCRSMAGR